MKKTKKSAAKSASKDKFTWKKGEVQIMSASEWSKKKAGK